MKNLIRLFAVLMLLVCKAVLADVTFVHTDVLGSPVAETNSDGQLVRLSHYKPFGEELEQKKDDVAYTGHKYDAALGLIYMQARYYDPVIGRFYSNDPVGFTGEIDTFNRYSYVANNPYKYIDPTGEEKISLGLTGEAMLFAGARVGFSVSCDTETLEIGATYTAGPRLGVGVGVEPSLTIEQSGEVAQDSSNSEIAVTADVTVGAISYGGEVMSENTLSGDVKNQASFGEPKGKVGLGASVGVEFKGKVTSDAVKQALDKIKKTFE